MVVAGATTLALGAGQRAHAQGSGKLQAAAPVTYDNRFEVYGGLEYMDFIAAPQQLKLMNLGGAEFSGTYWLTRRWGVTADYRGAAGTTTVQPNPVFNGNALVYLQNFMAGATYRVAQNQHVAFDLHAYGGGSHGTFDETLNQRNSGLYPNETKPMEAIGANVDFNRSAKVAIRFSPDAVVSQWGPGNRVFYQMSLGIVYRIGHK